MLWTPQLFTAQTTHPLFKEGWLQPWCSCGERKKTASISYYIPVSWGWEVQTLHLAPHMPFMCLHSWFRQTGIQMGYIHLAGSTWALSTAVQKCELDTAGELKQKTWVCKDYRQPGKGTIKQIVIPTLCSKWIHTGQELKWFRTIYLNLNISQAGIYLTYNIPLSSFKKTVRVKDLDRYLFFS